MQSLKVCVLVLISVLLGATGCSLVESNYVSNPDVDVAQFETYSWVTSPLADDGSDLYRFDSAMRQALSENLADKGYRPVAEGGNMLVDFRLGVTHEMPESDAKLPPQGVEFERNSNTNTDLNPTMDISSEAVVYARGEIVVTFYSPDQQQRYWEGSVSMVTEKAVGGNIDELESNVPGYVDRILRKFPKH